MSAGNRDQRVRSLKRLVPMLCPDAGADDLLSRRGLTWVRQNANLGLQLLRPHFLCLSVMES